MAKSVRLRDGNVHGRAVIMARVGFSLKLTRNGCVVTECRARGTISMTSMV